MLPGVLHVAWRALRALRLGDLWTGALEEGAVEVLLEPGMFSLPVPEMDALGAEPTLVIWDLLSVM